MEGFEEGVPQIRMDVTPYLKTCDYHCELIFILRLSYYQQKNLIFNL